MTEPDPDAVAYLPIRTDPRAFITLVARATGDPSALTPLLREEVRAIDPNLPLFNIRTMDQDLARQRWPFRVFGTLFTAFAAIALLLSSVGLYAVTAYSVTQRTSEIGVRMALGARSVDVLWLVLRRALWQLAVGLPLGAPIHSQGHARRGGRYPGRGRLGEGGPLIPKRQMRGNRAERA